MFSFRYRWFRWCQNQYRLSLLSNVGKTSERRGGTHMVFPERIDTILNWTELLSKPISVATLPVTVLEVVLAKVSPVAVLAYQSSNVGQHFLLFFFFFFYNNARMIQRQETTPVKLLQVEARLIRGSSSFLNAVSRVLYTEWRTREKHARRI